MEQPQQQQQKEEVTAKPTITIVRPEFMEPAPSPVKSPSPGPCKGPKLKTE